jgi:hypothetical protein
MWEGFPVIIVGTSDADRHFHPLFISVARNEGEDDFFEIFSHISNRCENLRPKVLIADCANAISNAAARVFGEDMLRVHCWFHVSKKFKENLNLISSQEEREAIKKDLSFLQLAPSLQEFEAGKSLWLKKWNTGPTAEFAKYVEAEYFLQRANWFEGYAPGYPKTNNGLESINATVKNENTLRNKLPLGEFFATMEEIVNGWSWERDPATANFRPFCLKPSLDLRVNTDAFEWATDKTRAPVRSRRSGGQTITYFIPSAGTKPLADADIDSYLQMTTRCSWKKFDTYRKCKERLWVLGYDERDWESSTCSCPVFSKTRICKHVVGIAITRKVYDPPPEAKTVPLGEKRKRGRPSKAKKALLVD